MSAEKERFLRISEVMAMLGISRTKYCDLRNKGLLGRVKKLSDNCVRHPLSCIVEYMDSIPEAD